MGFRAIVSMDSMCVLEMVPSELIPRLVEVAVVSPMLFQWNGILVC